MAATSWHYLKDAAIGGAEDSQLIIVAPVIFWLTTSLLRQREWTIPFLFYHIRSRALTPPALAARWALVPGEQVVWNTKRGARAPLSSYPPFWAEVLKRIRLVPCHGSPSSLRPGHFYPASILRLHVGGSQPPPMPCAVHAESDV